MLETVISLIFAGLFLSFLIYWVLQLVKVMRQRRIHKYTDPMRAMDITGRVRQLKVRGDEDEAVRLVQDELAMPMAKARSWVKSI
ncbi:hypothetical protein ACIBO2_18535 [Nonomuraea sp. NPDC050022]|uniref:hypothetical protein n=1 Tax=unclassified Nonomuraea TaxID=2593643 RepID=UPI0033F1E931